MRPAFTAWINRNHGWKYRIISPNDTARPTVALTLALRRLRCPGWQGMQSIWTADEWSFAGLWAWSEASLS